MENPRRRRLIAYFEGPAFKGDRALLIRKTGLTKGRVAQLFDPDESFGEAAARNLARRLGLEDEFFEVDRDAQRRSAPELFPVFSPSGSIAELALNKNGGGRFEGKVALAVMDVRASMGQGISQPSHDEVVMSMVVDETWLRRHANFSSPDQLALVTGMGDSMFPTFENGDPLLVDRAVTDIKIDAVYVLSLNDELYIKRVQRRPDGTIMMISDNKNYEPYHVKGADRERFHVLGRVVMVWNAKRI